MIAILLVLNLVISCFNAWSVGRSWCETKAVGGFPRFMSWMGATASSVGFSWCYLVIIALIAGPDGLNTLPKEYVEKMFSLGYVCLVIPLIGSGLAITIDSWAHFWRKRTFGNAAVAGYNTFADVYNIYQASRFLPEALGNVGSLFKDSDDDDSVTSRLAIIAIALAAMALIAGVLTAAAIIRTVALSSASERVFKYQTNV